MITQSFGATENPFPGFDSGNFSSLLNLRFAFKDALAHGVTGFTAKAGYDLASGWGTIDAAKFVPALARFG